ncbi:hypothetical protein FZEAL_1613 [Fusarium zealandicum]|uniref:Glycine-rich domain-containing protein 1 n=1 Tax=Fusarium zealandicum TaxID=1053134 RepID=A0A8H4XPB0_9HYPO|nr:hypothetical protein FZEAL_1613 [Fusarium zealandicum]
MSLESRDTKTWLHQLGKAMVTATDPQHDEHGKPYQLAYKAEDRPIIPEPSLFDFDQEESHMGSAAGLALPQIPECAAHLELLETLYVLRQRILVSDKFDTAMSIRPNRETKTGHRGDTKTFKDETLWGRRQVKWPKFVEFAVVRFLAWRERLNRGNDPAITDDNLPPLDVIMVWHAFLLNPLLFRKHCSEERLFSLRLPWKCIHNSVNSEEWTFDLTPKAAESFEETFDVDPDLFHDFETWDASSKGWLTRNLGLGSWRPDASSFPYDGDHPRTVTYAKIFDAFDSDIAKQLRDAVIRQTAFIDKMNAHMWIRSPALEGTLRRGIDRYQKFCKLFKLSKNKTIVPTLDIDLVWHTHQCTAKYYGQAMNALVGKFINHDDTIAKGKLGDGFGDTRRLFRVHFGREYRACGCWDCQALLTELEKAGDGEVDMVKIASTVQEQVFYYRAVEWSRRKKRTLPMRRPLQK